MKDKQQQHIRKLSHLYTILGSETKLKILFLCKDKQLNITQVSQQAHLGYSTTSEYISILEKAGLMKKERNDNETYVTSLIEFNDKGEFKIRKTK